MNPNQRGNCIDYQIIIMKVLESCKRGRKLNFTSCGTKFDMLLQYSPILELENEIQHYKEREIQFEIEYKKMVNETYQQIQAKEFIIQDKNKIIEAVEQEGSALEFASYDQQKAFNKKKKKF